MWSVGVERGGRVCRRERGLFTWIGCVLLFTGVIFTVHSVTDGVLGVLTEEETVAVSAVDVPA